MRRLVSAVVLLSVTVLPASAKIGESVRALEVRYGRPVRVSDTGDIATYRRGRLSVVVHFSGGVADMVSYRKLPIATTPLSHEPAPPFTQEEVLDILKENGGEWVPEQDPDGARFWMRADGTQSARWEGLTGSLTIYSTAFAQARVDA